MRGGVNGNALDATESAGFQTILLSQGLHSAVMFWASGPPASLHSGTPEQAFSANQLIGFKGKGGPYLAVRLGLWNLLWTKISPESSFVFIGIQLLLFHNWLVENAL